MKSKGTIKLETDRLILRKGKMNDAKQIFENYGKDPLVSRYVVWDRHTNVKDAENLMKKWEESYKNDNSYKWVVIEKNTNMLIGSITAVKVDEINKTVALGYCYGSKWWNNGYATEALKMVIKFFFEKVGVETIYANHLFQNVASGRVMEKAGMKFEGVSRNRMIDKITKKPISLKNYSIIREEYMS